MDSNDLLPPGLLVHATPDQITAHLPAIALLQPVALIPDGVVCAPRAGHDLARRGYAVLALETSVLAQPPGWPDPPSLTAGEWFIRSPGHIRAPAGYVELTQVAGDGFGTWPHPTTVLCLEALDGLGPDAAIDLGCGSGLLTQAWATTRGPVEAVDLDPYAIAQTRASLDAGRPCLPVTYAQAPFGRALPGSTAPVLLANVPPVAHREIAAALNESARLVLASGVRTNDADAMLNDYRHAGFRIAAATASGPWGCWVLERE
jgi:ribosomal protein L11 methylase PrmA